MLPCFKLARPIFITGELLRVEAGLLMALGDLDGAESRLMQALDVARQQKGRSCELRIAVTLSRLRKIQNRTAEGREVLSRIFESFSEGFDTADLIEARAELH